MSSNIQEVLIEATKEILELKSELVTANARIAVLENKLLYADKKYNELSAQPSDFQIMEHQLEQIEVLRRGLEEVCSFTIWNNQSLEQDFHDANTAAVRALAEADKLNVKSEGEA